LAIRPSEVKGFKMAVVRVVKVSHEDNFFTWVIKKYTRSSYDHVCLRISEYKNEDWFFLELDNVYNVRRLDYTPSNWLSFDIGTSIYQIDDEELDKYLTYNYSHYANLRYFINSIPFLGKCLIRLFKKSLKGGNCVSYVCRVLNLGDESELLAPKDM